MSYAIHRLGDIVEGHQNDPVYYTPISDQTRQDFLKLYNSYDKTMQAMQNSYVGSQCHIVGCGSSINQYAYADWHHKFVIGVNRAFTKVPKLDIWLCVDDFYRREQDADILAWYRSKPCVTKVLRRGIVVSDNEPTPTVMVRFSQLPSDKLSLGLTWRNSAIQAAIDFARHLGFSEIYLWGVDYDAEYAERRNFRRVVESFETIHEACLAQSVKVFNCNPQSQLKVLPFVNPETFFPAASVDSCGSTPSEDDQEDETFVERTEVYADHIDFYYGNELLVLGMDDLAKYKNSKALAKAAKLLSSVPQRLDE